MKMTLISSTNYIFKQLEDFEMNVYFTTIVNITDIEEHETIKFPFDFRHGTAKTSLIRSINIEEISLDCFIITVKTRNSVYVFRQGVPSNKPAFTNELDNFMYSFI